MIPKECKRLAEVDFPIAEVSRHAAREKSIRHGHPSTLHLWWARRPLASSRAVLLALLWPDPCDPLCPDEFKAKARELLPQVQGKPGHTDEDLRKALLKFIANFANWDLAANRTYLEVSRALVKAAHGEGGESEDEEPADDDDEEGSSRGKAKGFTLVFDVVRRFAQPLGIELPKWEGRVIETKKGVVRLLPIAERAKQLFGEDGAQAVATRLEQEAALGTSPLQGMLFPEVEAAPKVRGRGKGHGKRAGANVSDESLAAVREATTLDRIHAAMLLQSGGRTNALRALLKAEQERGPDFLRLANALSALYPKGSEEKRLLDAMLLAVPR